MIRRWLIAGVVLLLAGSVVLARTGVVRTSDGHSYQGEIREEQDTVTVVIRGVETVIQRDSVEQITYTDTVEEQFEQRLAALEPNDLEGRLKLARWAFDQKAYDLAIEATSLVLAIDRNSREAVDLQNLIRSQIRLERAQQRAAEEQRDPPPPVVAPNPLAPLERRFLDPEQINRIKQLELQPGDQRVRIRFENNVQRRYAEATNQSFARFTAQPPVRQAIEIMNHQGPDAERFARDVRITNDPAPLREFKTQIQPAVLSTCATSGCHGSTTGGPLILYTPADTDAVSYTNFYILQSYRAQAPDAGGIFGGGERKMIDRNRGESSLLVQFGLPQEMSQSRHPPVKNFRPMFRNRNDPVFRRVVDWMNVSLRPVTPDYGIDFDPPRMVRNGAPAQAAPEQPPAEQAPPEPAAEQGEPERVESVQPAPVE